MSKAEERALEAYPITMSQHSDNCKEYDSNESDRLTFIEGYHQAEKDLTDKAKTSSGWDGFYYGQGYKQAEKDNELTWEDIRELHIIFAEIDVDIELCKTDIKAETIGYYEEVLNRFNKLKQK